MPRAYLTRVPTAVIGCFLAFGSLRAIQSAGAAPSWEEARVLLVEKEVAVAGIKHPAILAVMRSVPRHEFVPANVRTYAYLDMALPIGNRQTISPPFVVAWMTRELDPQPTDRVLEIGTGSGYQAAVLSGLVDKVYTIEIEKDLARRAQATFDRLGYKNIEARIGDGYQGWPEHAPFDKIIVTCSPESVPPPLVAQLRTGGRIVVPLGERYQQTLVALTKQDGRLVVERREPTFFVPMTGEAERARRTPADDPLTPLVNGDFEETLESGKPAGWYYVRQAALRPAGPSASSKQHLVFESQVPGISAQALQAVGVDGRRVRELEFEVWIKARDVAQGSADAPGGCVLVSLFDEQGSSVALQAVGPWTGSFDWRRRSARLKVPPSARTAIVAVGLLGARGQLSCDELRLHAIGRHSARP